MSLPPDDPWALRQVTRASWGAKEPTGSIGPVQPPVPYVRFVHTGTAECLTVESCSKIIQDLQKAHMEEGRPDITYNFLIGGDGKFYEGRGWKKDAERSIDRLCEDLKGRCLEIAYLGDYSKGSPTWDMQKTGLDAIKYGLKNKIILCTFEIVPFRDEL